jgi:predicted alpha/beta-hydrolase family hydrolase
VTPAAPGVETVDVATPEGLARAYVRERQEIRPESVQGTLVLGHGAGGGIGATDLTVAAGVALEAGYVTVLVEQPWRVAGRRVASPAPRLDVAWLAVIEALFRGRYIDRPLIVGGRSAGARVACRTAQRTGAAAVLALSFPLHPPGRPERSRAGELEQAGVQVFAVQGRRDPFGRPGEIEALDLGHVTVLPVDGDHSLVPRGRPATDVEQAVRLALGIAEVHRRGQGPPLGR